VNVGLRERLIAVLTIVSALTLAVCAVTLFSPLDRRLRQNALENFAAAMHDQSGTLTALSSDNLTPGNPRLIRAVRVLRRRNAADIAVLSAPDGRTLVTSDPDTDEQFAGASAAVKTGQPQQAITGGSSPEAQIAFPLVVDDRHVVLTARKRLDDLNDASAVVRRAFIAAGVTGVVGALLVGLLLAGHLAARLRRLRDTALRVAEIGPVAEMRPDTARDEIGDLSRAFAAMQERLREQEQARRAFVATASHELRTPLSSLSVMLDMLSEDLRAQPADVPSAMVQAANAEHQVARLSQLAGELLNLSRIDAGVPLRNELVDLAGVLRGVVAELDVRVEEQGRQLEADADASLWAVGDPGSVAQIVRVLLDNALRHTPAQAGVRASVALRDGMGVLFVEDDGPGVAPGDRERIFERFARGVQADDGGFGLGLAIARELARQMKGDLVYEDGRTGARFALVLPGAPAP
jgi:signal transduction histidine kinase